MMSALWGDGNDRPKAQGSGGYQYSTRHNPTYPNIVGENQGGSTAKYICDLLHSHEKRGKGESEQSYKGGGKSLHHSLEAAT